MARDISIRRLLAADAAFFKQARIDALREQPLAFRSAPEDEAATPLELVARRLETEHVVGAYRDGAFLGMGGVGLLAGAKLRHKALIWGMYVRPEAHGAGVADQIMRALLDHGAGIAEIAILTVIASNPRAVRFYQRWGFRVYGTEARSIKIAENNYLDEFLMARALR